MSKKPEHEVEEVPIDSIKPSPEKNPRKDFKAQKMEDLRLSIKAHGILEPILVHKSTREIIDGERRWRAAKDVSVATIPVEFYDVSDFKAMVLRINAQHHSGLTGIELENAIYEVYQEAEKTGEYATDLKMPTGGIKHIQVNQTLLAADLGMGGSYVTILLNVANDRRELSTSILVKQATTNELNITKSVEQTTRDELLVLRKEGVITYEELKNLVTTINEAQKEVQPEIGKLLEQRKTETIGSNKELTARVEALKEATPSIRELIVSGVLTSEDFTEATVLAPQNQEAFLQRRATIKRSQENELHHDVVVQKQNEEAVKEGKPPVFIDMDNSEEHRNEDQVERFEDAFFKVEETFVARFANAVTNVTLRQQGIAYVQKTMLGCSIFLRETGDEVQEELEGVPVDGSI